MLEDDSLNEWLADMADSGHALVDLIQRYEQDEQNPDPFALPATTHPSDY